MVVSMVVAVMVVGLCIIRFCTLGAFRGGGQGLVDVRSCPSLDEIESVIEHACGGQSFKIFLHRLDAPWKSDYQSASYGSSYWT